MRGRFKATEQGEVVHTRYANPAIAHRHLEQVIGGVLLASAATEMEPDPEWVACMDWLAKRALITYRRLVPATPGFLDYFTEATPIREIGELTTSSRPQRRGDGGGFELLRAIPWVFSWNQSRANIPGWYGVGAAFSAYIAADAAHLSKLQAMYRDWAFFRSLVDTAQISVGTADMGTAELYASLVNDVELSRRLFRTIKREYVRTEQALLAVTEQERILDHLPVLRDSILLRNPYVDPMHAIQVELLRRIRATDASTPDAERDQLRYAVQQTINGIAAGLQATG
jgi:phosphoenolpyruvate carboxylase